MPLPTGDTIGILADNLRLRRSVLPIPRASAIRWTQGLDLPRGGFHPLIVAGRWNHIGSRLGQSTGQNPPDARGSANHHGDLTV